MINLAKSLRSGTRVVAHGWKSGTRAVVLSWVLFFIYHSFWKKESLKTGVLKEGGEKFWKNFWGVNF